MRSVRRGALALLVLLPIACSAPGGANVSGPSGSSDGNDVGSADAAPEPDDAPVGRSPTGLSTTEASGVSPTDSIVTTIPAAESTTEATSPSVATETTAPTEGRSPSAESRAERIVDVLSSDNLGGRDNLSSGSARARGFLVKELMDFAEPAFSDRPGVHGYLQPFDQGTNIIAVLPGTTHASEYVVIGAHYDAVGPGKCRSSIDRSDTICNGAIDNATGVATVMDVARSIAAGEPHPRSLVVALWDTEEDGLVGSRHYVDSPVVPLERTVVYINYDMQGSELTPAAADWTTALGADTGGTELVEATEAAIDASPLHYLAVGIALSQARSDFDPFLNSGIPIVSFSDAPNGCYHTVDDEVEAVDFDKLDEQIEVGRRLLADLLDPRRQVAMVIEPPQLSFDTAVQMLDLLSAIERDVGMLPAGGEQFVMSMVADLELIVNEGPERFDPAGLADGARALEELEEFLTGARCTSS